MQRSWCSVADIPSALTYAMVQLQCMDSGYQAKNKDGTRRRSGCLECRRRKRRCDEQKPKCLRCGRLEASCIYPDPTDFSDIRIVISQGPAAHLLPMTHSGEVEFINIVSKDVPQLCSQYDTMAKDTGIWKEGTWVLSMPRCSPSCPIVSRHLPYVELEAQLIQYCGPLPINTRSCTKSSLDFEIISTSRVNIAIPTPYHRAKM